MQARNVAFTTNVQQQQQQTVIELRQRIEVSVEMCLLELEDDRGNLTLDFGRD